MRIFLSKMNFSMNVTTCARGLKKMGGSFSIVRALAHPMPWMILCHPMRRCLTLSWCSDSVFGLFLLRRRHLSFRLQNYKMARCAFCNDCPYHQQKRKLNIRHILSNLKAEDLWGRTLRLKFWCMFDSFFILFSFFYFWFRL